MNCLLNSSANSAASAVHFPCLSRKMQAALTPSPSPARGRGEIVYLLHCKIAPSWSGVIAPFSPTFVPRAAKRAATFAAASAASMP